MASSAAPEIAPRLPDADANRPFRSRTPFMARHKHQQLQALHTLDRKTLPATAKVPGFPMESVVGRPGPGVPPFNRRARRNREIG